MSVFISLTFRLNVPVAGKQPKLGYFYAFLCDYLRLHSVESVRYERCVGGNVPYLYYVHSVVNAGNIYLFKLF